MAIDLTTLQYTDAEMNNRHRWMYRLEQSGNWIGNYTSGDVVPINASGVSTIQVHVVDTRTNIVAYEAYLQFIQNGEDHDLSFGFRKDSAANPGPLKQPRGGDRPDGIPVAGFTYDDDLTPGAERFKIEVNNGAPAGPYDAGTEAPVNQASTRRVNVQAISASSEQPRRTTMYRFTGAAAAPQAVSIDTDQLV